MSSRILFLNIVSFYRHLAAAFSMHCNWWPWWGLPDFMTHVIWNPIQNWISVRNRSLFVGMCYRLANNFLLFLFFCCTENPSDVVRYLMVLQPGDGYPSWVQPQAPETPLLGTVFPVPWKRLLPAPKIGFLELLSRHRSLKQVAANSMPEQPMIAAASFRKRDRYNCDLSRVSIQMIIEYLRTRRICGFRVNQMRFALGGK